MSVWSRISEVVSALIKGNESLSAIFDGNRPPPERSVAFTIAVICLGAKMAKADGQVIASEVTAFRQVFHIGEKDEADAARVFDLARKDVAGFEVYAKRISRMFEGKPDVLEDLLEGLFHIAMADGRYHESEEAFLRRVAEIFGLGPAVFASIESRYVADGAPDPWRVLGVSPADDLGTIRARWRKLVRENHPDRMIARGLPEELVDLANGRIAAFNAAWEEISRLLAGRETVSG